MYGGYSGMSNMMEPSYEEEEFAVSADSLKEGLFGECPYCHAFQFVLLEAENLPGFDGDRQESINKCIGAVCKCEGAAKARSAIEDLARKEKRQREDMESFEMLLGQRAIDAGFSKPHPCASQVLSLIYLMVRSFTFESVTVELGDSKLLIKTTKDGDVETTRERKVSIKA
jgi:hypothetical protein